VPHFCTAGQTAGVRALPPVQPAIGFHAIIIIIIIIIIITTTTTTRHWYSTIVSEDTEALVAAQVDKKELKR